MTDYIRIPAIRDILATDGEEKHRRCCEKLPAEDISPDKSNSFGWQNRLFHFTGGIPARGVSYV